VKWRRLLLSLALVGGSIWCLAAVRQVQSQERAAPPAGQQAHLQAGLAGGSAPPAAVSNADLGNPG